MNSNNKVDCNDVDRNNVDCPLADLEPIELFDAPIYHKYHATSSRALTPFLHALKRIDYIGVTFRTRTRDEVLAINNAMRADLWEALEQRKFEIPIDKVFPLEAVVDAQAYLANNQHFGKVLLASG